MWPKQRKMPLLNSLKTHHSKSGKEKGHLGEAVIISFFSPIHSSGISLQLIFSHDSLNQF